MISQSLSTMDEAGRYIITDTDKQRKQQPWQLCQELVAQEKQNLATQRQAQGVANLPAPEDVTEFERNRVAPPSSGLLPDLQTLYGLTGPGNYLEIYMLVNSLQSYQTGLHPHTIVMHEDKDSNRADKNPSGEPNFWMLYHDDERKLKGVEGGLYTKVSYQPSDLNDQYKSEIAASFSIAGRYRLNSAGDDLYPNFHVHHIDGKTGQRTRLSPDTLLALPSIKQGMTQNAAEIYLYAAVMLDNVPCMDKGLALQTPPAAATLMYRAARNNASQVLGAMIDRGFVSIVDQVSLTRAVSVAARYGHIHAVKLLGDAGADVSQPSRRLELPLHAAADQGHEEIVDYLYQLAPATLNTPGDEGRTAINQAAFKGHALTVKRLLSYGAKIDIPDDFDQMPLDNTVRQGHIAVAQQLVAAGGNAHRFDRDGQGLLHKAVQSQSQEMFDYILTLGVPLNKQDKDGNTAMHIAATTGRKEMIAALVKAGANPDLKDANSQSPIDIASATFKDSPCDDLFTPVPLRLRTHSLR